MYILSVNDIPPRVLDAFSAIRQRVDFAVVLRRFGKRYYVYKATSRWDKKRKRVIGEQEYLGKITDRGRFIEKVASGPGSDLRKAEAIIKAYGGRISYPKLEERAVAEPQVERELLEVDKQVLTMLSMNARMPISLIAKRAGLSRSEANTKIKNFEKRYGMRYILETDVKRFGLLPYLIFVKFDKEQPPVDVIKKLLQDEPKVQFAAMTKGDYDLVIYWLDSGDPISASGDAWKIEASPLLKGYGARWDVLYFGQAYSFVPLRNEFIDMVLKKHVWHKKGEPSPASNEELKAREFALLRELNEDCTKDFTEIDARHNLGRGASRYTYLDLKRRGIIVRPTITLAKLSMRYLSIILAETLNAFEEEETISTLLSYIIDYNQIMNKHALTGNIGISTATIFFTPIARDSSIEGELDTLRPSFHGVRVRSLIVSDVIVGQLCYRRFDNDYSRQYARLVSIGKAEPKKLVAYE